MTSLTKHARGHVPACMPSTKASKDETIKRTPKKKWQQISAGDTHAVRWPAYPARDLTKPTWACTAMACMQIKRDENETSACNAMHTRRQGSTVQCKLGSHDLDMYGARFSPVRWLALVLWHHPSCTYEPCQRRATTIRRPSARDQARPPRDPEPTQPDQSERFHESLERLRVLISLW